MTNELSFGSTLNIQFDRGPRLSVLPLRQLLHGIVVCLESFLYSILRMILSETLGR
ncbi:hypothetical protein TRIATDRAFT_299201 [Trichoderma atroviride IMI 206040]|uniref:Uncharacterized protein n=1 Tax=Hypocrea atroviridis (strain ATCC 20476 / IMI 206040) TaxID=452589 RepID=G9NRL4_HYPAI|nr:uncharacterized protein TRIATDRAFT_299201 [Trichoderma atroviride IMI 206040]EHK46647.1 hypothetical protein TRIATDRAFT_299201 [Trichoderma atroviride IMI 206040]